MPFCTQCGHQNPDGARFCSQCGTRLEAAAAAGRRPAEPPSETTATITFGAPGKEAEHREERAAQRRRRGRGRRAAAGQRAAGRAARAERRQPVPARHRRGHRRAAPRQRDLPRRRDGVAPARRVPSYAGRATPSPTSAASTAPTSTATGSTRSRCRAATRCRSASTAWSTSPATAGAGQLAMRQSASSRARLSIGEVLGQLRGDFPDLNISKIRFLEAEGLIEPERTPSGYRKFSHQDVERLRYVLTAQREHYLPLKVIREHLDAIDRGLEPPALNGAAGPQVPRVVLAGDGYPSAGGVRRRRVRAAALPRRAARPPPRSRTRCSSSSRPSAWSGRDRGTRAVRRGRAGDRQDRGGARGVRARAAAPARVQDRRRPRGRPGRAGRLHRCGAAATPRASARAEEAITQMAALSVRLHATLVKAGLRS